MNSVIRVRGKKNLKVNEKLSNRHRKMRTDRENAEGHHGATIKMKGVK